MNKLSESTHDYLLLERMKYPSIPLVRLARLLGLTDWNTRKAPQRPCGKEPAKVRNQGAK